MALDGPDNTVIEVNTVVDGLGPDNPYNNSYYAVETPLLTEKAARRRSEPDTHRFWKIVNPGSTNRLGKARGY